MLLRLYGAHLFTDFITISESQLAKGLKISEADLKLLLNHLQELQVVDYQPVVDGPQITFVLPRQDADRLPLNHERLEARKKLAFDKMNAMVGFVTEDHRCRMQRILDYFGEQSWQTCGKCDVCIAKHKKENLAETKELQHEIMLLLKTSSLTSEELENKINPRNVDLLIELIREMVDAGQIEYDEVWRLKISKV